MWVLGESYLLHVIVYLIKKPTNTSPLELSGKKTFTEIGMLQISLTESQHFGALLLCQLLRVPDKILSIGVCVMSFNNVSRHEEMTSVSVIKTRYIV